MARPQTFGGLLRMYRDQAGYTQEEFAEMLSVNPATIIRYEQDKRMPPWDFVLAAAAALDKTPNDFMPRPDEPEGGKRK